MPSHISDVSPTSPARVLVVEDSAIIAMDLQERLIRMGFDVCGMSSRPQRAIELARDLQPDLVLLDYSLNGELTGVDVARILRARGTVAILFVTGHANSMSDSILAELRAVVLGKPFSDDGLATAIRAAFAARA